MAGENSFENRDEGSDAKSDATEENAKGAKLTLPLWLEGFATYVSGEFNPSASEGTILLDKDLAKISEENK